MFASTILLIVPTGFRTVPQSLATRVISPQEINPQFVCKSTFFVLACNKHFFFNYKKTTLFTLQKIFIWNQNCCSPDRAPVCRDAPSRAPSGQSHSPGSPNCSPADDPCPLNPTSSPHRGASDNSGAFDPSGCPHRLPHSGSPGPCQNCPCRHARRGTASPGQRGGKGSGKSGSRSILLA